jgi:uncharacterized protein (TIGR00251 family)
MELEFRQEGQTLIFPVRVVPRASPEGVAGVRQGALLVRLGAAPVEGQANRALVALLARALGVPRAQVEIRAGHTGRTKVVAVSGASREALERLLR